MPKKPSANLRLFAYLFLMINVLTWGATVPIVKPVLSFTTPFRFLLYRFTLAAVLSIPFLLYYVPKTKNLVKKLPIILCIEFLGSAVGLSLLYIALNLTSALEATIIAATSPIFTILGGIFFLQEREEKHEVIGLILAFIGTLIITLFPFLSQSSSIKFSLTGNFLIILQNVITAVTFLLVKKHYKGLPKLLATSIGFYVGAVSFFFLSLWQLHNSLPTLLELAKTELSYFPVLMGVSYAAVFTSIIGLTAYLQGQEYIEASEASLFSYLQPLVAIPLSVIFLNEKLHWLHVLALFLTTLGVFIAEKRFSRHQARKK